MIYRLWHETRYNYEAPVTFSHNQVHLSPRATTYQRCLDFNLLVSPLPDDLNSSLDVYKNSVSYFSLYEPHYEFVIRSESRVEVFDTIAQPLIPSSLTVAQVQQHMKAPQEQETRLASEFLYPSPYIRIDAALYEFAASTLLPELPIAQAVEALMKKIFDEFEYDPDFSSNATPLASVLEHRKGVCQDFAHLAIACLRAHGVAARYVSGYLETDPPEGEAKLVGCDASHAWFAAYVPSYGWLDFDPTNNQIPNGRHITVSWGRDYADVTPLKGIVYGGGKHTLDVSVDVRNEPLFLEMESQGQSQIQSQDSVQHQSQSQSQSSDN